jgi:hypothetical protein
MRDLQFTDRKNKRNTSSTLPCWDKKRSKGAFVNELAKIRLIILND